MTQDLIVYRPSKSFTSNINEYADEKSQLSDNEIVYDLNVDTYDEKFRNWISEITHNTTTVARAERNLDITDNPISFDDLYPNSNITDIISRETPGGDIRKYTTNIYGGCDRTISFMLFRSMQIDITGFEPVSIETVRELIERGVSSDKIGENPYYPEPMRIIKWSEIVQEKYDLECGAMGNFHFIDDKVELGFNGFVIYGTDDEVMRWAGENWSEDSDEIFMRPDEFTLYDSTDYNTSYDSVIRMWWD